MGLVHVRFADHGLGGADEGPRVEAYLRRSTEVNSLTSCLRRNTQYHSGLCRRSLAENALAENGSAGKPNVKF